MVRWGAWVDQLDDVLGGRKTHPLLLHELAVGAVIDDIPAKDRRGQDTVDLLGIDILGLAIQDELVALGADIDGGLLAEENEGENIAKLCAVARVSERWWDERLEGKQKRVRGLGRAD